MSQPPGDRDDPLEVVVIDEPAASRYEARVGGELAGFADYVRRDDRVVFPHAEVFAPFGGRGVGTRLARFALDDVIAHGKVITPMCPFIVDFIRRNPSYVSHVDDKSRSRFHPRPTDS